ncbi:hypothetical protein BBJ28_00022542, partial [Nothophytophthora sp. Chile5]
MRWSADIRDLISVEDVMEELGYGPNGGLVYCMEYLVQNLDWLQDLLTEYSDDDYFIFDCPGWLIDSLFIVDPIKFISGVLCSLSAMVQLELPHINVLTKCDLVDEKELTKYLDPSSGYLLENLANSSEPRWRPLSSAICNVINDFSMVAFVPMNINREESIETVLMHVDHAINYGDDLEPQHEAKLERYAKERTKYLATLQEEVNCGRELVSSKYQIDGKALQAMYERLGYPVSGQSKSHIEELVWQVNDNLDGAVCFEEFENSYVRSRNDRTGLEPSEVFFLTCFLMFDKECCGKVRQVFSSADCTISEVKHSCHTWCCIAMMRWTRAMALAGLLSLSSPAARTDNVVEARLVRLPPKVFDDWREAYRSNDVLVDEEPLEDQIARYTREDAFPKAGRTLEEKIRAANEFLDRELSIAGQRGVGVEEGKLAWDDPVKKHLPSFELYDKYAEEYVTIGDLCAMNSGLNELPDIGRHFGLYQTDEDLVRGLKYLEPAHTLRGGHDYANSNFAILGQVIKSVSGQAWDVFLKERIWDPLGMTRTFASAF